MIIENLGKFIGVYNKRFLKEKITFYCYSVESSHINYVELWKPVITITFDNGYESQKEQLFERCKHKTEDDAVKEGEQIIKEIDRILNGPVNLKSNQPEEIL